MEISEKIKFKDVCDMFEKISNAKGGKKKELQLRKYIDSFLKFQKEFKEEYGQDASSSFYCVLRLLIPNADPARESYGLKETAMGKLYVKILNLSPSSEDALKLTYNANQSGDFSDIVFNVMKTRAKETTSDMTLLEVNSILDTIAENDIRKKEQALTKFIEVGSAIEQKWLIRIILKKLHLGIGEKTILSIYHPNANHLNACNTDLKQLCCLIESNNHTINNNNNIEKYVNEITENVCLFKHIRPMLCEQLQLHLLDNILQEKQFYLETKMDGERFHLHINDGIYKYFSRNGRDYTQLFGSTTTEGNLTPILSKLFNINIKNAIFDGEMMVWDKELMSFRVKGENYDVKHLQIGGNLRPCFVMYDLLYLNDVCYVDKSYKERTDKLEKIVKVQCGVTSVCKRIKLKNLQHFKDCFNEALNQNEEGVVIKEQTSKYSPGIRGSGWYKVKADYIKGLVCDFDLLIIGLFCNKQNSGVSYLLGVYKKPNADNEKPEIYAVTSVGSGLTKIQYRSLYERLEKHLVNSKLNKIQNYQNGEIILNNFIIKYGSKIPDYLIEPQNSIILQVKASELHTNSSYATKFSLRFPRIEAIRDDKLWNECMTLDEYEIISKSKINSVDSRIRKLNKRDLCNDDFSAVVPKRSKAAIKSNYMNPYGSKFKANEVSKVSDAFNGLSICILSGSKKHNKTSDDLKEIVVKHGGKIVENPSKDHEKCLSIAGDITPRVKRIKETHHYIIISADWLIRAFDNDIVSSKLSQLRPSDMICTTVDMDVKFKELYDEYGDSYTEKVNVQELKEIFDKIKPNNIKILLDSELNDMENELQLNANHRNIFRKFNAALCSTKDEISKIMMLAKLTFESRGGYILDYKSPEEKKRIKYIFVDPHDSNKMNALKLWLNENFEKKLHKIQMISFQWVFDSDKHNKKLDFRNYLVTF